ncbi:hypothetical protein WJX82_004713 [Trebouxia sp. C0006]
MKPAAHNGLEKPTQAEDKKQQIRQMFQDLGSSLEQQPHEVLPLHETLLSDGHFEAAIMVIDAALISAPQHTELLSKRACLDIHLQPLKAIQTFSECFEAGGGSAEDYLIYGQLLFYEAGHWQASLDAISHAVDICELPSTVGGVATAVAIFNRAAAMEPSNARVRQQRGACKDTLGDHTGAIENLSAAIQLGLDNALTYRYRGLANLQLG